MLIQLMMDGFTRLSPSRCGKERNKNKRERERFGFPTSSSSSSSSFFFHTHNCFLFRFVFPFSFFFHVQCGHFPRVVFTRSNRWFMMNTHGLNSTLTFSQKKKGPAKIKTKRILDSHHAGLHHTHSAVMRFGMIAEAETHATHSPKETM